MSSTDDSGYSYDRRKVAESPANRLKNASQYLRQGDRQIEESRGVLHGLMREMEMMAHHTSNPGIRENFAHIQQFAHRLDAIDAEIDHLLKDMERAEHTFK